MKGHPFVSRLLRADASNALMLQYGDKFPQRRTHNAENDAVNKTDVQMILGVLGNLSRSYVSAFEAGPSETDAGKLAEQSNTLNLAMANFANKLKQYRRIERIKNTPIGQQGTQEFLEAVERAGKEVFANESIRATLSDKNLLTGVDSPERYLDGYYAMTERVAAHLKGQIQDPAASIQLSR